MQLLMDGPVLRAPTAAAAHTCRPSRAGRVVAASPVCSAQQRSQLALGARKQQLASAGPSSSPAARLAATASADAPASQQTESSVRMPG